jgi:hypothetical protein
MPGSGPNDINPPPPHARGADLSLIPKAADVPSSNLEELLGVDSANPFLRARRIEHGFLKASALPRELSHPSPLDGDTHAKLRDGEK